MARNRAIVVALAFSLIFHLSMITLFQIVVIFPEEHVRYFPIEIVNPMQTAGVVEALDTPKVISLPDIQNPFAQPAPSSDADDMSALETSPQPSLPEISLPTLAFAELERLEVRETGIRLRTDFDADINDRTDDSWSRFGHEVEGLRAAVIRIASSLGLNEQQSTQATSKTTTVRPAPGLIGRLEWKDGRMERELIYAPPIVDLWGGGANTLVQSAPIGFRVNAEGRVIEVLPPIDDDSPVVEAAARQLLRYRFEPIFGDNIKDQQGTLLLTAEPVLSP